MQTERTRFPYESQFHSCDHEIYASLAGGTVAETTTDRSLGKQIVMDEYCWPCKTFAMPQMPCPFIFWPPGLTSFSIMAFVCRPVHFAPENHLPKLHIYDFGGRCSIYLNHLI